MHDVASPAHDAHRHHGWLLAVVLPAIVATLALRGLVASGYLLHVDAVFGPRYDLPGWSMASPLGIAIWLVHVGFGGEWAGRIVAGSALYFCGFAPMVLLRRRPWWAQCCAGLLGMLNPWVYDRATEGQWPVVAAAGSLFLWVAAFEALQRQPRLRSAVALALATVLTAALSVHFVGLVAVLAVAAILGTRPWRDPQRLRWTAAALGLAGVLLLYGILPFFLGHGPGTYTAVQSSARADFVAFRPTADSQYGTVPALFGLYGEWAERTGRMPVATTGAPWWIVSAAVLVGLAVAGAMRSRPRRRWLLGAGVIGILLSAATAPWWGLDATVWLSQRVPLVAAYRDTQKWAALWLVALVVLAAEAVAAVPAWTRRRWAGGAAALVMVLATLLPAGVNQLREMPQLVRPVTYPADWYAAAAYLRANVAPGSSVVVLPWHLYEPLPFTARLTANPASVFFPGRLVVPNDPELPGQMGPPPSPDDIGTLATNPEPRSCALAEALRSVGVRWVVVEATVGARDVLRRLRPCGFVVMSGGAGLTSVLRG